MKTLKRWLFFRRSHPADSAPRPAPPRSAPTDPSHDSSSSSRMRDDREAAIRREVDWFDHQSGHPMRDLVADIIRRRSR